MRNDERLRTIYEVMAPYIVRNEHNWRDYLAFASQFHKHSFDNILLVYAQDEDVSILATRKQWAAIGRNLIPRAKGVAVCVYRNAKLTLDYLFDVSQTTGKEIHPTDWQLSDEMKKGPDRAPVVCTRFPQAGFSPSAVCDGKRICRRELQPLFAGTQAGNQRPFVHRDPGRWF